MKRRVAVSFSPLTAIKVIWVAACIAVLAFAWQNRTAPDTDLAVLWAMIILTFPMGLTLATLGTVLLFGLDVVLGATVPGGFGFNLVWWFVSFFAGYWWWFVLLPKLTGRDR